MLRRFAPLGLALLLASCGQGGNSSLGSTGSKEALRINTTSLPTAYQNEPYGADVQVAGGVNPYTLRVTSGQLPPGVVLSGQRLQGTPTANGRYEFILEASDASLSTKAQTFAVTVGTLPPLDVSPKFSAADFRAETRIPLQIDYPRATRAARFQWKLPAGVKVTRVETGSGGQMLLWKQSGALLTLDVGFARPPTSGMNVALIGLKFSGATRLDASQRAFMAMDAEGKLVAEKKFPGQEVACTPAAAPAAGTQPTGSQPTSSQPTSAQPTVSQTTPSQNTRAAPATSNTPAVSGGNTNAGSAPTTGGTAAGQTAAQTGNTAGTAGTSGSAEAGQAAAAPTDAPVTGTAAGSGAASGTATTGSTTKGGAPTGNATTSAGQQNTSATPATPPPATPAACAPGAPATAPAPGTPATKGGSPATTPTATPAPGTQKQAPAPQPSQSAPAQNAAPADSTPTTTPETTPTTTPAPGDTNQNDTNQDTNPESDSTPPSSGDQEEPGTPSVPTIGGPDGGGQ